MFLLRLQLLNTVKGEKKTQTAICAPSLALQLGRRQMEKPLLATRGTSAGERRCLPSQGTPPPLAVPPKTTLAQSSWHLGPEELSRGSPACYSKPESHLFLQTPPFPSKEDLMQPLMKPSAGGFQFPRLSRSPSACSCPSKALAAPGPPEPQKVCWL